MLNQLERLAQRLAFLKIPLLLLALIGLTYFIFTLEIPGVLLLTWSLLVFTFLSLFQTLPPALGVKENLVKRFISRIKRTAYLFLAVFLIILSLAFVGMTLRGLFVYLSH